MRYICLAAGKGTRFLKLGTYLQKCMYPIGGIPFLEFSVKNLLGSGAFNPEHDSLCLVVGSFSEQIRNYFTGEYSGTRICYVDQGESSGTGHAILRAYQESPFTEPAVVWLADTYISPELFRRIRDCREEAVLTVALHVCDIHHGERVTLSSDRSRIIRAWEGTGDFVDTGLWKVPPSMIDFILACKTDEFRFLPAIEAAIQRGLRVGALISDRWVHLGGTEPSVTENLRMVTDALLREVTDTDP